MDTSSDWPEGAISCTGVLGQSQVFLNQDGKEIARRIWKPDSPVPLYDVVMTTVAGGDHIIAEAMPRVDAANLARGLLLSPLYNRCTLRERIGDGHWENVDE